MLINLDEIERKALKATKGPRTVDRDSRPGMDWNNHVIWAGTSNTLCFMAHGGPDRQDEFDANADLIAALSPETVLALVRIARAARTLRQNWKNGGVLEGFDELREALTALAEQQEKVS